VPRTKLLQALSLVPWAYALLWYLATSMSGPPVSTWANWGWLAVLAFEVWAFLRVRKQERDQPPP